MIKHVIEVVEDGDTNEETAFKIKKCASYSHLKHSLRSIIKNIKQEKEGTVQEKMRRELFLNTGIQSKEYFSLNA